MRTSTSPQRSHIMRSVKQKNTKPEILVRKAIHTMGARFRLNVKCLPGSPDIVLKSRRICIFVHGCFWHRHANCRYATTPKSNVSFWRQKFAANRKRDEKAKKELKAMGWKVVTIWGCETRDSEKLGAYLASLLVKSKLELD